MTRVYSKGGSFKSVKSGSESKNASGTRQGGKSITKSSSSGGGSSSSSSSGSSNVQDSGRRTAKGDIIWEAKPTAASIARAASEKRVQTFSGGQKISDTGRVEVTVGGEKKWVTPESALAQQELQKQQVLKESKKTQLKEREILIRQVGQEQWQTRRSLAQPKVDKEYVFETTTPTTQTTPPGTMLVSEGFAKLYKQREPEIKSILEKESTITYIPPIQPSLNTPEQQLLNIGIQTGSIKTPQLTEKETKKRLKKIRLESIKTSLKYIQPKKYVKELGGMVTSIYKPFKSVISSTPKFTKDLISSTPEQMTFKLGQPEYKEFIKSSKQAGITSAGVATFSLYPSLALPVGLVSTAIAGKSFYKKPSEKTLAQLTFISGLTYLVGYNVLKSRILPIKGKGVIVKAPVSKPFGAKLGSRGVIFAKDVSQLVDGTKGATQQVPSLGTSTLPSISTTTSSASLNQQGLFSAGLTESFVRVVGTPKQISSIQKFGTSIKTGTRDIKLSTMMKIGRGKSLMTDLFKPIKTGIIKTRFKLGLAEFRTDVPEPKQPKLESWGLKDYIQIKKAKPSRDVPELSIPKPKLESLGLKDYIQIKKAKPSRDELLKDVMEKEVFYSSIKDITKPLRQGIIKTRFKLGLAEFRTDVPELSIPKPKLESWGLKDIFQFKGFERKPKRLILYTASNISPMDKLSKQGKVWAFTKPELAMGWAKKSGISKIYKVASKDYTLDTKQYSRSIYDKKTGKYKNILSKEPEYKLKDISYERTYTPKSFIPKLESWGLKDYIQIKKAKQPKTQMIYVPRGGKYVLVPKPSEYIIDTTIKIPKVGRKLKLAKIGLEVNIESQFWKLKNKIPLFNKLKGEQVEQFKVGGFGFYSQRKYPMVSQKYTIKTRGIGSEWYRRFTKTQPTDFSEFMKIKKGMLEDIEKRKKGMSWIIVEGAKPSASEIFASKIKPIKRTQPTNYKEVPAGKTGLSTLQLTKKEQTTTKLFSQKQQSKQLFKQQSKKIPIQRTESALTSLLGSAAMSSLFSGKTSKLSSALDIKQGRSLTQGLSMKQLSSSKQSQVQIQGSILDQMQSNIQIQAQAQQQKQSLVQKQMQELVQKQMQTTKIIPPFIPPFKLPEMKFKGRRRRTKGNIKIISPSYKPSVLGEERYRMFGETISSAPSLVGLGLRLPTKKQVKKKKKLKDKSMKGLTGGF